MDCYWYEVYGIYRSSRVSRNVRIDARGSFIYDTTQKAWMSMKYTLPVLIIVFLE